VLHLLIGQDGAFALDDDQSHVDVVGRWYNHAAVLVERNNHGHAVLLWLRDYSGLNRLGGQDGNPGWQTTTKG
jgi:hypothetical protein